MSVPEPIISRIHSEMIDCSKSNVSIREKQSSSAGKGNGCLTFIVQCTCISIRLPSQPVEWLSNQKCADGIIFELVSSDRINLHLVELKSKVTAGVWAKVKGQLEGALLNAKAVAAVLELPGYSGVAVHIAFSDDAISPSQTAAPSTLKLPLGHAVAENPVREWLQRKVVLLGNTNANIFLVQRDENGDAVTHLNGAHFNPL